MYLCVIVVDICEHVFCRPRLVDVYVYILPAVLTETA